MPAACLLASARPSKVPKAMGYIRNQRSKGHDFGYFGGLGEHRSSLVHALNVFFMFGSMSGQKTESSIFAEARRTEGSRDNGRLGWK